MGDRWLTDLADVVAGAGLTVVQVDGWQYIARSSGGYGSTFPDHVMVHHTASGPGSDGWSDVNYITFNADAAPLANLYLSRDGTVWVCAAGATNTNGSGIDPCGRLAPDTMNTAAVGIEAANSGTGEPWPAVQLDAYETLVAALCAAYGIDVDQVHAHFEYAPSRKIDPAGPHRYATGGGSWDMAAFRAAINGPEPGPVAVSGVDVSKWQGRIDWPAVRAAGYTWCAARTWDRQTDPPDVDETFAFNRDGMSFARWRFLYYWLEPGRVAEGVEELFASIGQLRPGEGVMLDAEEEGITEAECVAWLEAVEARTGVPCAVYTGGYTADGTIWRSARIYNGRRARVFAAYTDEDDAHRHAAGIAWDAWQYSATGEVPGIAADCDLDRIDHPEAFDRCLHAGTPTPPPEDDTMAPFLIQHTDQGWHAICYGDGKVTGIDNGNTGPWIARFGDPLPCPPSIWDDFTRKGT